MIDFPATNLLEILAIILLDCQTETSQLAKVQVGETHFMCDASHAMPRL